MNIPPCLTSEHEGHQLHKITLSIGTSFIFGRVVLLALLLKVVHNGITTDWFASYKLNQFLNDLWLECFFKAHQIHVWLRSVGSYAVGNP